MRCFDCDKELSKDEIGVCKKLLGRQTKVYYCLDCFAAFLDTTQEEILSMIQEFKEQGCTLFS